MPTAAKLPSSPKHGTDFLSDFAGAGRQNAEVLARANQIISETSKAIWSRELDLFRLEAEQLAKLAQPVSVNGDLGKAIGDYCARWQEGSEKAIAEWREMGDLVRDCGWRLMDLYSSNFAQPKNAVSAPE